MIKLAEVNGLIPKGLLTVSTFNRRHLLDASGSNYLYIKEELSDGDFLVGIRHMAPGAHRAEYKGIVGLWALGIVDDRSRCIHIRYYASKGEDTIVTLKFLQEAWQFHPDLPFGGLPEILQTDNSAFARNRILQGFFDTPGIEVKRATTMPYSKEAQGKIERVWRTWKAKFEQPYLAVRAVKPDYTMRFSELNEALRSWIIEYNTQAHPLDKVPRADVWRDAMAQQTLHQVPENLAELPFAIEEKTLSAYADFQVQAFRNNEHKGWFHVPTRFARRRVLVFRNALGQVLIRDPQDIDQDTVEAVSGRREIRPSYDQITETGETIRVYEGYQTGSGLGKEKTPMQRLVEEPVIPEGTPLIHPNVIQAEGASMMSLAPHQEESAKIETPFTRKHTEFPGRLAALEAISRRLGVQLLQIQKNHQAIWIEIEHLLESTLNREVIESHCKDWARRLRGSMYGIK